MHGNATAVGSPSSEPTGVLQLLILEGLCNAQEDPRARLSLSSAHKLMVQVLQLGTWGLRAACVMQGTVVALVLVLDLSSR